MAKGYSTDLRTRAVALAEAGESRREVARLLDRAASTTIRWMDLWQTNALNGGVGELDESLLRFGPEIFSLVGG